MTDRLNKILAVIPCCDTFADIGCDHGYIAKAMLDEKKCKRVILADVSAKCLKKAEKLLGDYMQKGVAFSVVSNGFERVENPDVALIAGMGGMEIISILKSAKSLPSALVLQPMKNSDKVRITALELGYKFLLDKTFLSSKKFYDIIVLTKGKDDLSASEIEFGRTNIKEQGEDFKAYIKSQIKTLQNVLKNENLSLLLRQEIEQKIGKLKEYA